MIETNLRNMTVVGRAGADPEVSTTKGGKKLATFSIAVNEWDPTTRAEETKWVRCSAFEREADLVEKHIRKGMRVWATGQHSLYDGQYEQLKIRNVGEADVFFSPREEEEGEGW